MPTMCPTLIARTTGKGRPDTIANDMMASPTSARPHANRINPMIESRINFAGNFMGVLLSNDRWSQRNSMALRNRARRPS